LGRGLFFQICPNQKDDRKAGINGDFGSGEHLLWAIVPYPQRIFGEEDMAIRGRDEPIEIYRLA
jgi:hypothetical protein